MKQQPITTKETPSWKNTLDTNRKQYGTIDKACGSALSINYPFFARNGLIYEIVEVRCEEREIGTLKEWGMT